MKNVIPFPPIFNKSHLSGKGNARADVIKFPIPLTTRIRNSNPLPKKSLGSK